MGNQLYAMKHDLNKEISKKDVHSSQTLTTTSITTFSKRIRNISIIINQILEEISQLYIIVSNNQSMCFPVYLLINMISNNTNDFTISSDITGHIILQHG